MEIINGSTYKEVRKQHIARNQAFMKEIGLQRQTEVTIRSNYKVFE